eukprot:m.30613 g.30613  ORF g.30613 m.30613 type:complete len:87 (-) comp9653_c0_seq2:354-614(-)
MLYSLQQQSNTISSTKFLLHLQLLYSFITTVAITGSFFEEEEDHHYNSKLKDKEQRPKTKSFVLLLLFPSPSISSQASKVMKLAPL